MSLLSASAASKQPRCPPASAPWATMISAPAAPAAFAFRDRGNVLKPRDAHPLHLLDEGRRKQVPSPMTGSAAAPRTSPRTGGRNPAGSLRPPREPRPIPIVQEFADARFLAFVTLRFWDGNSDVQLERAVAVLPDLPRPGANIIARDHRTPHEPRPPASATAIDSDGADTAAIGASRIGTRRPKRLQKLSVRFSMSLMSFSPDALGGLWRGTVNRASEALR